VRRCSTTDRVPTSVSRPAPGWYRFLGYTPAEYASSLRTIAEGLIDVAPLLTDVVDLDGVAEAFAALAGPTDNAKIVVIP
jgi:threonine dehydrogenase-like Zn-dependent dehydrogenase